MGNLVQQIFGEYRIIGRRFFVKFDNNKQRIANAHFFQTDNAEIEHHILFRDYMRLHPKEALLYSNLKAELVTKYPYDINGYIGGKDVVIKNIGKKTGFSSLYIRQAKTIDEWNNHHKIRKTEIFTNREDNIEYNSDHPSITDPNNKRYIFYKGFDIIGALQTEHFNNSQNNCYRWRIKKSKLWNNITQYI